MFRTRFFCLLTALCCLAGLAASAAAAEVDCSSTYCFSSTDFSTADETLNGICITGLPDPNAGTVMLGSRVLRTGDILTAGQVDAMTFVPLQTQQDLEAVVTFLPIYDSRVEGPATMTISIRGKEDKAPVAQDSAVETYKNLPREEMLKATDPEGQAMTYTVIRQPKRGEVTIRTDGSFLYMSSNSESSAKSIISR